MQRKWKPEREPDGDPSVLAVEQPAPDCPRGCYGIQILIAGRHKHWRDEISAQIRRAGFVATTVDSAVDALTVLALGLPVDVLLSDLDLYGDLCCSQLAVEARVLRPNLSIVLANDLADDEAALVPDAFVLPRDGSVASTVREALASRSP